MKTSLSLLMCGSVLLPLTTSFGAVYFSEDFNAKVTQNLIDAGWNIGKNEFALETGTDFGIAAAPFDGPSFPSGKVPGGNFTDPNTLERLLGPPGADGYSSATLADPTAGFLISDSDSAGGSDDVGSKSEFYAVTPPFSTAGSQNAWFHADTEYEANNNGECIADVSASIDGGQTWIAMWATAEPQRPVKSYRYNTATDPTYEGSTPMGGYPVLGSASQSKSWSGIHGRWHLPLPSAANNKPDVRIRVRFYEPADAWWIAMDNIVVDDNLPPQGSEVVLLEQFERGIPASWPNNSNGSHTWGTEPLKDGDGNYFRRYTDVDGTPVYVNIDILREAEIRRAAGRLTAPPSALATLDVAAFTAFPELVDFNPNEPKLDGRFIMMLAGQNYAIWSDGEDIADNGTLDTPTLNLASAKAVFLDFDSEVLFYNSSEIYEVQASVDNGQSFQTIFTYFAALADRGEASYFMHHYLEVPAAAGKSGVVFRFNAIGGDPGNYRGFWVIDNVRVTVNRTTTTSLAITNIRRDGPNVIMTWAGGTGPFTIQKKTTLTDANWVDVGTATERTFTTPIEGATGFFRIADRVRLQVTLNGANERPTPIDTPGTGSGTLTLDGNKLTVDITYSGLTTVANNAHIHGPATTEEFTGVLQGLNSLHVGAFGTSGSFAGSVTLPTLTVNRILAGLTYVNIHTTRNPNGEIRGQIVPANP